MKRIIREPLLQFLLIGAMLFLVFGVVNNDQPKNEIIVDDLLVKELSAKWESKRKRPPNLQEIAGMISDYIKQEVLYKEALEMNLDHNDEIIKRRLAQKMEFISDGLASTLQPNQKILKEYYEESKENYPKPSQFSIKQVFFNSSERENAEKDAFNALNFDNPEKLGDKIMLPVFYENTDENQMERTFGKEFTNLLSSLPENEWSGPLKSGLGFHIVYISNRNEFNFYTYEEIANRVLVDYNFDATKNFNEELLKEYLRKYEVEIEVSEENLNKVLNERY